MELVSKLLKEYKFTDLRAIDKCGNMLLHLAVNNDKFTQMEMIKALGVLLDTGAKVDNKNFRQETVLQLAIRNRMKDVIDFLLTRKANSNAVTHSVIQDEIKYQIDYKYNQIVKFRKESREKNNLDEVYREIRRMESERANFIEWLISRGFDFSFRNERNQSALCMAIEFNLQHILPVLLRYTKHINFIDNSTNETLLHLFLRKNIPVNFCGFESTGYSKRYAADIVRILLDSGVSADAEDIHKRTPIRIAIENSEDIDVIEILLENCKNVNRKNSRGDTLFHRAINNWLRSKSHETESNMKILRTLIAKGADVNEPTELGQIPLWHAIEKHNLRLVKFLRDNRADFGFTTKHGETLMHILARKSHSVETSDDADLFDILIGNGCQVDAKDKTGVTPLHRAATDRNVTIVRKLLEHDADVNCTNNRMETPLICWATRCIETNVAKLLLDHGANVNAMDCEGSTALHAAAAGCSCSLDENIIKFLLKYEADFNARTHAGYSALRLGLWRNYNEDKPGRSQLTNELPSLTICVNECRYVSKEVEILLEHWIKLDVANLKCITDDDYRDLIKLEKYKSYRDKCSDEIGVLKSTLIDSRTSLYNLLHMNPNRRRAYINNEKLQQLFHSPKLKEQYPEYAVLILASYREAAIRGALLEPAKKAWLEWTEISLPDVCIEHILSFLSNDANLFFITTKN